MSNWYESDHWLAYAPSGKWSSGPVVISADPYHGKRLDKYREMGYSVYGPFTLKKEPPHA